MKSNFPPKTAHEREINWLLNVLGSVVLGRSAVYVSTPITSGRRFADWSSRLNIDADLAHPETYQEFLREVLEPNSAHARTVIKELRSQFNKPLIDPTALKDIEGWIQDDYRFLWARVIEQYAGTVVFLNGWQYSNGCAYEFLVANQVSPRRVILKETIDPLMLDEGISLVKAAIVEFRNSRSSVGFLEHVSDELTRLQQAEVLAEA